jgi:hypothetical protein
MILSDSSILSAIEKAKLLLVRYELKKIRFTCDW